MESGEARRSDVMLKNLPLLHILTRALFPQPQIVFKYSSNALFWSLSG
jgi:hypothetical protein